MIIELDGKVHLQHIEKDERRDKILEDRGFKIIRIKNEELSDINKLKVRILDFIKELS